MKPTVEEKEQGIHRRQLLVTLLLGILLSPHLVVPAAVELGHKVQAPRFKDGLMVQMEQQRKETKVETVL
jgi:hypothetical protein